LPKIRRISAEMQVRLAKKYKLRTIRHNYLERISNFSKLKSGLIKKYVEEGLDLEDRQQESIFKITDSQAGDNSLSEGYFRACTGFGKTYLMKAMVEGYLAEEKNKKIIIFEENTKVLEQVKEDLIINSSFSDKDVGTFYGQNKSIATPIIICTYASMEKMIKQVGEQNIGMVLCDEAHHILSENRQRVAKRFANACLYGFTATPDFNEAKNCAQVFGNEIDNVSLMQGVQQGLLCSVKNGLMVSRVPVDLTGIKSSNGDYDDEKLLEAIEKASHKKGIRESLVEFYLKSEDDDLGKLYGKTTLINVPNQKEADTLAEVFNETAGKIIAKSYHTNSGDEPLNEFNAGKFPVLIQVNRLSEGYNNPKIELCINYPTASLVRETQCSGRALRMDKNNPHKMALILDIVFKKNDGSDVYEQIAQNGQMLFKDVAGDVRIMAPEYQTSTDITKGNKISQEKLQIDDDMLFDIVTNYEELFKLAIEHEEYLEDVLPEREKLETDVGKNQFGYWRLEQNGKVIGRDNRYTIWDELAKTEEQDILIRVKSGTNTSFVLPQENIPAFKKWLLANKGITVIEAREKLVTDVDKEQFRNSWRVEQNGKVIGRDNRYTIWDELQETEGQDILIRVKSGGKTPFVLPQENIPMFKKWLQEEKGITVLEKEIPIRERLETDVDKAQFRSWRVEQNGKVIGRDNRYTIWDELQETEGQDILIRVKASSLTPFILPQENIPAFKKWLLEKKGITVIEAREKLETDVGRRQFAESWILEQNGKVIGRDNRYTIWDELQKTKEQDILIRVQSGTYVVFVLPQENIPMFKKWLLEKKGITVIETRKRLKTDIDRTIFGNSWRLTQDGKVIGQPKDKLAIWDELQKTKEQDILIRVKSGTNTSFVLPQENISAFKKWLLEEKRITVLEKEVVQREKLNTDVSREQFKTNWTLEQSGNTLGKKNKYDIWDELQETEGQDILIKVKAGVQTPFVLPQENIPAFKKWLLEEKGIVATSTQDKMHELQEKAMQTKNPNEKAKYWGEAKKIFKKMNPGVEKQGHCVDCMRKISKQR